MARRAQIVAAAIDTLADEGYGKASLSAIAGRAGLSSTGLITYHFANKAEVIEQVVENVLADISDFMAERLARTGDPVGRVRSYIEGHVAYVGSHRRQMKALLEVFLNGGVRYDGSTEDLVAPLEQILADGQANGAFRLFNLPVVAAAIQRTLEGLPQLVETQPGLDLDAYAAELVTLFHRAIRSD